jgi:enoyl-CoA hydratase/carnithine racemase
MSYTKISVSATDGILTIELRDPPANTYSYQMMREIDAAVLEARLDASVHVIVLRGAGEKFFCAGANIGMLKEASPEFKYYFCLHANETLVRLEQTPKLVIAALNGHTVGGGLPEVALGVLPGTGGTQRLARLVGKGRAIELMATGRLMTFEEAKDLGIIHDAWGPDALGGCTFAEAIQDYARQFTPPHKASGAIGRMKRAVHSGVEAGLLEGLSLERELQQLLFQSEDAKEGLAANVEKRKPEFKGR